MRAYTTLILLAVLIAPIGELIAQQPAGKPYIAVLDLDVAGATSEQALALSNQLRSELLKTGRFVVVDRSQVDAILDEQAFQQLGCTSEECAVQVGRILGIQRIVSGTVTRAGDQLWQVSAILVDVETAETLRAETLNHQGGFSTLLLTGIRKLAARLATSIDYSSPSVLESPTEIHETSYAPGWGVFSLGVGFGVVALYEYSLALDYDEKAKSKADSDPRESQSHEDDRDNAARLSVLSGIAAAALITWWLFYSSGSSEASVHTDGWRLRAISWTPGSYAGSWLIEYRW